MFKDQSIFWRFSFHPSSETQGQSVGSGEKARRKFSSTGDRAPGYRLSPNHFQKFKRMQAPDWAQKMLCIIVPNRRTASPEFFSWVGTRLLFLGLRRCFSSKKKIDVDQSTKTIKQYFSGWRLFLIIYDVNFNSIYFRNIFATLGLFRLLWYVSQGKQRTVRVTWHLRIQIWLVLLIEWSKFSTNQKPALPRSG